MYLLCVSKEVLNLRINFVIVIVTYLAPFRMRFNLRKANWKSYSTELDKLIITYPRKNTVGSWRCVWPLKGIFQGDVEQTTYQVYQRN